MKTRSGLVQGEQLIKYDIPPCATSPLRIAITHHAFILKLYIHTKSFILIAYMLFSKKNNIQGLQSFLLNVEITPWVILKVVLDMSIIILK